jgi:hypothetical protein
MLSKFSIKYVALPQHNDRVLTHHTDDPVEAQEFLMHLLMSGAAIKAIQHDGVELSRPQADRMLKVAAEGLASLVLRKSLGIDGAEVRHRFGFAA